MKQIKAILLIAVLALISCGGGGNDDPIIPETPPDKPGTPTTTSQTVTFKASTQLRQNVSLTGLKAAVSDFDNNINWVTSVMPLGYSGSGAPTVTITVSENTGSVSRSGDVTFTDTKGNEVILTITQLNTDSPDKPDNPYVPQTYQQSVGFGSWEAATQSVKLNNLNTAVNQIDTEAGVDWLTVEKESYTSGSPSVKLTVTANDDTKERSTTVTVTAENGDKVVLTVKQAERTYGIDDPHNNQSDQPAYSRQQ